jgi:hypothetical protein
LIVASDRSRASVGVFGRLIGPADRGRHERNVPLHSLGRRRRFRQRSISGAPAIDVR